MTSHYGPQYILIVEDDEAMQSYFRYRLERDFPGSTIIVASTLAEAKVKLSQEPIDAMLIDPGLPDSYGYQTIKTLMEAAPGVAAVGMTGSVEGAVKRQALADGAQGFYDKWDLMKDWERLQLFRQFRAEVEAEAGYGSDSTDRCESDGGDSDAVPRHGAGL